MNIPNESDEAGPVSHAEAREILKRFNASHWGFTDQERARYTIPPNPKWDDDIRLEAYINQCERAEAAAKAQQLDTGPIVFDQHNVDACARMLREAEQRLQMCLRESDIAEAARKEVKP